MKPQPSKVYKTDAELKKDILSELEFEPSVLTNDIGVLVKDGTVTLNGFATSYGEKYNAVTATKRVAGVTAIADDIEVKFPDSLRRTDGDIAAAADAAIRWSATIPKDSVQVTVREGWITLEGSVEWWYQKNAAKDLVQYMSGVAGVSNQIEIKPVLSAAGVEASIKSAFERSAQLDATKIQVETSGSQVTLRGKVRNYAEREEAERVAWAAPGANSVDNQIAVSWF
jgi:osmotically-inducible protein OsmY